MQFVLKIFLSLAVFTAVAWAVLDHVRQRDLAIREADQSIGEISQVDGFVQIKSGDAGFRNATVGTRVIDGDQILTGPNSTARIELGSGRNAVAQEESRISISSLEDSRSDPSIVIDGIRSTGITINEDATPVKSARPIVLLTSLGTIPVSSTQRVETKNTGNPKTSVIKKQDIDTGKTTVFTNQDAAQVMPSLITQPTPTPTPKPVLSLSAKMLAPEFGPAFWTPDKLTQISKSPMEIQLSVQGLKAPKSASIHLGFQKKTAEIPAEYSPSKRLVRAVFNLESLGKILPPDMKSADVSIAVSAEENSLRAKRTLENDLKITTLEESLRAGKVSVGLEGLPERQDKTPGWATGRLEATPERFPLVISVIKKGFGTRLAPLLRSAKKVGFSSTAEVGAAGTYVVRNQEIIAQISGKLLNDELSDKIRAIFDGDFVFTGPEAALISPRKFSVTQIQSLVNDSINNGKGIFVFQTQDVFLVNRDFLIKNPSVASFVKRNSNAFFTSKVRINSYR